MSVAFERSIQVLYPSHIDASDWEERYMQNCVPSRWPYGLDQLAVEGVNVVASTVRRPSLLNTLRAVILPAPGRGRFNDEGVTVTWDENTAVQMTRTLGIGGRKYSGVIWLTDTARDTKHRLIAAAARRNLLKLDGLWVLSRPQVELVSAMLGDGAPPVAFVKFGIDVDFFSAVPTPQEPLIFSAGGDRDRDTNTLYEALDSVYARTSVGAIVQTSSMKTPPRGTRVITTARHDEMRDLYARSTVVAVATHPNTHVSGMTVSLEAMATGRPVVITATEGIEDYVVDGVTGLTVPAHQPESMAAAIGSLLESPSHAATLGSQGRTVVEAEHSTRTMTRSLAALLLGIGEDG